MNLLMHVWELCTQPLDTPTFPCFLLLCYIGASLAVLSA